MLHPLLALFGLLSFPLSVALQLHPRQARCNSFTPDERDTWNHAASVPIQQVTAAADCRSSSSPCIPPRQATGGQSRQSLLATFHAENSTVNVDVESLKIATLVMQVGAPYKGEIPVTDEIGLFVPPGQVGYLAAYASAVEVPGRVDGCDDGGRYRGKGVFPSTKGLGYRIVVMENKG